MKRSLILSVAVLLSSGAPTLAAPLGTRTVLDNGATLLVAERPGIPMVVMTLLLKTGAVADPEDKAGLANLTAALLTRGTELFTAQALAEELDYLGASLTVDADYETTTLSLTTLTKNLERALTLLAQVIRAPTFPVSELERKRKEIIGRLHSREEDPGWVARKVFLEKLYPHHPFGRLVEGQPSTLATITQDDVKQFHHTYYRPNNAIIALAGDITQPQAVRFLNAHLADWQPMDLPAVVWPEAPHTAGQRVTIDKTVSQANVLLGHPGIARSHPDYYAVLVMNYILGGGGFGSRLMDRIREELGLVYSISSSFTTRKHPGPFVIGLQTKNASALEAIDESLQVIRRFIEQGASAEELAAAKAYFINSFPLRLVSNRDVAALLPVIEFYELGLDYPDRYADLIGQVTLEQVHDAARTHLHLDQLVQVVVADLNAAGLTQPTASGAQPATLSSPP
jgi:zinc protease